MLASSDNVGRVPPPPLDAKNLTKIGEKMTKSIKTRENCKEKSEIGKRETILKKRQKSGRFFNFVPSES